MVGDQAADSIALADDPAWQALGRELDRWAAARRRATLWWRDDDAAEATAALERLLALVAATGIPLALAVVPGRLSPALASRLAPCEKVTVLQHGWRHDNHAGKGEGGWELGDHRPLAAVAEEVAEGRRRLADAFGGRFLPVLAPPWNHITDRNLAALPELGFIGVSTFRARAAAWPVPGLAQVNGHCDPISWKGGVRFSGTGKALADLTGHLQARRTGDADPDEPSGLVTHHLAMDEPAWAFVAELLRRSAAHPAALWQSARDVFRT